MSAKDKWDRDREERKLFTRWWIWALGMLVIAIIVLGMTGFAGRWIGVTGDRIIFDSSYQKQSADRARVDALEAEAAQIGARLSNPVGLSDNEVADLKANLAAIEFQLRKNQ